MTTPAKKQQILGVLWDHGNVLDSHKLSDVAIADTLGIPFADFQRYSHAHIRAFHLGLPEMEYLQRVCQDAGVSAPERPIIREIYDAKRPLNQTLLQVNEALRRKGIKTGILSNAEPPLPLYLADCYGPQPPFDTIVYSCEVKLVKPDPEIYRLGCARLGVLLPQVVFVDDNLHNVEAFRRLGGIGIHHRSDERTIRELSEVLGIDLLIF